MIAGKVYHLQGVLQHLFPGFVKLETDVKLRGRDEDAHHLDIAVNRGLDIRLRARANPQIRASRPRFAIVFTHCFSFAETAGNPASMTSIPISSSSGCNIHLFLAGKRYAGCLFPVPKRDVTDLNIQLFHD